ncbi:MAG: hypothetical protein Q4A17_11685 [Thermoguttaceae bacterium]|nr:hypothetical protein [Thermoguttaceae bacterium]
MIASVIIQFDRQPHDFEPREIVTGTFRTVDVIPEEISRLEFSVLWFTEGKGDEDLGVHFFKSLGEDEHADEPDSTSGNGINQVFLQSSDEEGLTYFFSVGLPSSPLTWHGKILKIYWCVRVRLYLKNGREVMSEREFNVGKIPPVHVELN